MTADTFSRALQTEPELAQVSESAIAGSRNGACSSAVHQGMLQEGFLAHLEGFLRQGKLELEGGSEL